MWRLFWRNPGFCLLVTLDTYEGYFHLIALVKFYHTLGKEFVALIGFSNALSQFLPLSVPRRYLFVKLGGGYSESLAVLLTTFQVRERSAFTSYCKDKNQRRRRSVSHPSPD